MATVLFLTLLVITQVLLPASSLEIHFYRNSCPRAEIVVRNIVQKHFQKDPSLPAGLLRLHFHDCFIRGCDASVLIDSTDDNVAEKEAPPNQTLRGFEVIDEIKEALEKVCKGVVSCADILALATRDGVALSGGAAYALPTGRRDGIISNMEDVHLISPSFGVSQAMAAFQAINMDLVDLTTLLGAHTVGFCHCGFFIDRLYNFQGTGLPDPLLDPGLLQILRQRCPIELMQLNNLTAEPTMFINQATSTPFRLDGSIYRAVFNKKALLKLDQELAFTDFTSRLSARFLNDPKFFIKQFSKSMIKLGNVGVLTGQDGEIRQNCRRVNINT